MKLITGLLFCVAALAATSTVTYECRGESGCRVAETITVQTKAKHSFLPGYVVRHSGNSGLWMIHYVTDGTYTATRLDVPEVIPRYSMEGVLKMFWGLVQMGPPERFVRVPRPR